jgi:hypothetical protein
MNVKKPFMVTIKCGCEMELSASPPPDDDNNVTCPVCRKTWRAPRVPFQSIPDAEER